MSQKQATSRVEQEQQKQEAIKYGDLFKVSGELSTKPVAPQDAAMMQLAEARVYGQTRKGGPAAIMQQAATLNERAGMLAHTDVSDPAADQGVTIVETDVPGARIFTESVAGQVVAKYVEPTPVRAGHTGYTPPGSTGITIGEALEASAQTAADKPVDQGDAAAIQAAEVRATGSSVVVPGGLASTAQSAAAHNAQSTTPQSKVKLGDLLANATWRLAADKVATRQDAEGVVSAELRNDPELQAHPGGVAASVAAAARLNERHNQ